METILWWLTAAIVAAIIFGIAVLAGLRLKEKYRRWAFDKRLKSCQGLLTDIDHTVTDNIAPAILRLNKTFSYEI